MMKLNEGFLDSMKEAFARFRACGPAEATEVIQRALRGEQTDVAPETREIFDREQPPVRFADILETLGRAPVVEREAEVEDCGHFSTRSYANAAGQRNYKLYVPSGYQNEPLPLIVMLHGCTQNADDFAAGTQMNELAETHNCIVVYPIQPQDANPSKCWNWFKPDDQRHDRGEPSLIAGITRDVMASHSVDPKRVYIAGLSAGGAMAAIMAHTYPDLYAAAGIHSGLPVGCAHDLPSALAAMRGGKSKAAKVSRGGVLEMETPKRPLIVFHGDADATVHFSNATELMRNFGVEASTQNQVPNGLEGGRRYTVKRLKSESGVNAELWTIHGAPHAWAGGSQRGSYTDPAGPNASAEMVRFFLEHPRRH
jgi:poly(hydroxyalkanoate) depolymerase family esterase